MSLPSSARTVLALVVVGGCAVDVSGIPSSLDGGPIPVDAFVGEDLEATDASEADSFVDECPTDPEKTEPGVCGCGVPDIDGDGDGVLGCNDCDDADSEVRPGGVERCSGADEDCDGRTDEGLDCGVGCADGEREGFVDQATFPRIAGCSGSWSVPGTMAGPACGLSAGDDAPPASGCSIADLCGAGWHVCRGPEDVAASSPTGCDGAVGSPSDRLLFIQAQSGPGGGDCGVGVDDLFGCGGSFGSTPGAGCAPLTRRVDRCNGLPGTWSCGASVVDEAANVTKPGADDGGALCCRD